MHLLAGREGRCATGAHVPVTEYGLRVGVDNIGELSSQTSGNIPLRRMRILASLRLQDITCKRLNDDQAQQKSKVAKFQGVKVAAAFTTHQRQCRGN